jgi:hypothetical protein
MNILDWAKRSLFESTPVCALASADLHDGLVVRVFIFGRASIFELFEPFLDSAMICLQQRYCVRNPLLCFLFERS